MATTYWSFDFSLIFRIGIMLSSFVSSFHHTKDPSSDLFFHWVQPWSICVILLTRGQPKQHENNAKTYNKTEQTTDSEMNTAATYLQWLFLFLLMSTNTWYFLNDKLWLVCWTYWMWSPWQQPYVYKTLCKPKTLQKYIIIISSDLCFFTVLGFVTTLCGGIDILIYQWFDEVFQLNVLDTKVHSRTELHSVLGDHATSV